MMAKPSQPEPRMRTQSVYVLTTNGVAHRSSPSAGSARISSAGSPR